MDLSEEILAKVREVVEYGTGRPAYMADDEEWAIAVDIVMEEERNKGNPIASAPVCSYCGEAAPYGDERLIWLSVHEAWYHRWWWSWKTRRGW